MTPDIPCPTVDQCSTHAKVFEDDQHVGYAIWYPQMGGYVGQAVALISKGQEFADACFDVLVWHDGEFPFDGETGHRPIELHHCSPSQFVDFGNKVLELQQEV